MWRTAGRTRLGLSLVLGVIAGIALLSLPALVSPGSEASASDNGGRITSDLSPQTGSALPFQGQTGSVSSGSTSDRLALAFSLFLILLPGSVLSVFARRWATRKLEKHWYY